MVRPTNGDQAKATRPEARQATVHRAEVARQVTAHRAEAVAVALLIVLRVVAAHPAGHHTLPVLQAVAPEVRVAAAAHPAEAAVADKKLKNENTSHKMIS